MALSRRTLTLALVALLGAGVIGALSAAPTRGERDDRAAGPSALGGVEYACSEGELPARYLDAESGEPTGSVCVRPGQELDPLLLPLPRRERRYLAQDGPAESALLTEIAKARGSLRSRDLPEDGAALVAEVLASRS